jgi:hypothetical protein
MARKTRKAPTYLVTKWDAQGEWTAEQSATTLPAARSAAKAWVGEPNVSTTDITERDSVGRFVELVAEYEPADAGRRVRA